MLLNFNRFAFVGGSQNAASKQGQKKDLAAGANAEPSSSSSSSASSSSGSQSKGLIRQIAEKATEIATESKQF